MLNLKFQTKAKPILMTDSSTVALLHIVCVICDSFLHNITEPILHIMFRHDERNGSDLTSSYLSDKVMVTL